MTRLVKNALVKASKSSFRLRLILLGKVLVLMSLNTLIYSLKLCIAINKVMSKILEIEKPKRKLNINKQMKMVKSKFSMKMPEKEKQLLM